jgi:two-component system, NarL family, sensor kinase
MTAVGVQPSRVRPRRAGIGLRWRIVLTLSAVVTAAFLVGVLFLFEEAAEDRHAIAHRALAEAVTTATALDREVASSSFLLQGLSRSPALKADDHRAFYDQLTETPRPDGSWFVLWDHAWTAEGISGELSAVPCGCASRNRERRQRPGRPR